MASQKTLFPTVEYRTTPLKTHVWQTRADGPEVITGYAAVFYDEDDPGTQYQAGERFIERIRGDAFAQTLESGKDVRAYYNHNSDALLARTGNGTLRLSTDTIGLRYELDIDPTDTDHQRLIPKLRRGDVNASSFGFIVRGAEERFEGRTLIQTLTDIDLIEISPVSIPAYTATTAEARHDDDVAIRLRLLDLDDQHFLRN